LASIPLGLSSLLSPAQAQRGPVSHPSQGHGCASFPFLSWFGWQHGPTLFLTARWSPLGSRSPSSSCRARVGLCSMKNPAPEPVSSGFWVVVPCRKGGSIFPCQLET
jgi:hypothetical protein